MDGHLELYGVWNATRRCKGTQESVASVKHASGSAMFKKCA